MNKEMIKTALDKSKEEIISLRGKVAKITISDPQSEQKLAMLKGAFLLMSDCLTRLIDTIGEAHDIPKSTAMVVSDGVPVTPIDSMKSKMGGEPSLLGALGDGAKVIVKEVDEMAKNATDEDDDPRTAAAKDNKKDKEQKDKEGDKKAVGGKSKKEKENVIDAKVTVDKPVPALPAPKPEGKSNEAVAAGS